MDVQETKDLAEFKAKRSEVQNSAFSYMRHILRMTDAEIKASGHKTRADAVVYAYELAQKNIDNLLKEHLKKYPDE